MVFFSCGCALVFGLFVQPIGTFVYDFNPAGEAEVTLIPVQGEWLCAMVYVMTD